MSRETAGQPLGFVFGAGSRVETWRPAARALVPVSAPGATRAMAMALAPAQAPYPTTLPLRRRPEGHQAPWWSERMLLRAFRGLELLRWYTKPVSVVQ